MRPVLERVTFKGNGLQYCVILELTEKVTHSCKESNALRYFRVTFSSWACLLVCFSNEGEQQRHWLIKMRLKRLNTGSTLFNIILGDLRNLHFLFEQFYKLSKRPFQFAMPLICTQA